MKNRGSRDVEVIFKGRLTADSKDAEGVNEPKGSHLTTDDGNIGLNDFVSPNSNLVLYGYIICLPFVNCMLLSDSQKLKKAPFREPDRSGHVSSNLEGINLLLA